MSVKLYLVFGLFLPIGTFANSSCYFCFSCFSDMYETDLKATDYRLETFS